MTVSILQTLATLPSGVVDAPLTLDELSTYLGKHYNTPDEQERNHRHALRDEFYCDGGVRHMKAFIDRVFVDPMVREKRKQFVEVARFGNVLKRIVNECSAVYVEPAKRIVTDGNDNYQRLLGAVHIDEVMLQASRLLNLHRALLVGFRVRKLPDGTREPVLDVATPANVRAIVHPTDATLVLGWLIRTSCKLAREIDAPAWTLWTDHEVVSLRENMSVIAGTYELHGFGVCPWVPVTLGPAGSSGFWPGDAGEDLVAAHKAAWFSNILLMKEEKSATKQTVFSGDGTNVARGQAADSEVAVELQDGQTATTVDMSMDLEAFQAVAGFILDFTSLNYGLSPKLARHEGVQSAQARELMRIPLKELRNQQRIPLRRFEIALAMVMSAIVEIDMPELRFDPKGWRIEFSESETPLDPISAQTLFERRRAAGLDNTVAEIMRLRPGLTEDQAVVELRTNITVETNRNIMMRPLEAISGSAAAELPDGQVKVTETEDVPAPTGNGVPSSGTQPAA